jgi:hypothetical protein
MRHAGNFDASPLILFGEAAASGRTALAEEAGAAIDKVAGGTGP